MNEPIDVAIPPLGICANMILTHVHRVVCTRMRGENNWEKLVFTNCQGLIPEFE